MSQAPPTTSAEVRERLISALRLDLVGPESDDASRANERLEESPSRWYLTGFLVPRDRPSKDRPREGQAQLALEDEPEEDDGLDGDVDPVVCNVPVDESDQAGSAVAATKRQVLPSSMGLTVLVPPRTRELTVTVRWGDYRPVPPRVAAGEDEPEFLLQSDEGPPSDPPPSRPRSEWVRTPQERVMTVPLDGRGDKPGIAVPDSGGLRIVCVLRDAPARALDARLVPDGAKVVNLFLLNRREAVGGPAKDSAYIFQAEMEVRCESGFCPRVNLSGLNSGDLDARVADLQYRDLAEYATGHNVSTRAVLDPDGVCRTVATSWIPRAEVERVEPAEEVGCELGMEALADLPDAAAAKAALSGLVARYREWIEGQTRAREHLKESRREEVFDDLIFNARHAADRIERGIASLENPRVFRAFTLANRAMAMQARRRDSQRDGRPPSEQRPPRWRPFQLAFILLNIEGIADPNSPDRKTVELLFFPTGGGKTEAYLGLAAFTLIHRRLRVGASGAVPKYAGVAVMMRYTLRLLTLDQLSRATALICALELIRDGLKKELGDWPFEIGLWVGSAATPNYIGKRSDQDGVAFAVTEYRAGRRDTPPVPLEKCPWCGSNLGPQSFSLWPEREPYQELRTACLDDDCEFHGDRHLPLHMVDEPIYRRLPCFLIATVDKYAAMPWKGEVAKLFGRIDSYQRHLGFYGPCDSEAGSVDGLATCRRRSW